MLIIVNGQQSTPPFLADVIVSANLNPEASELSTGKRKTGILFLYLPDQQKGSTLDKWTISRRGCLKQLALTSLTVAWPIAVPARQPAQLITRPIPESGQLIPVIGMGSHITFNVGNDRETRLARAEVMRTFFDMGGQLIDSSPMYGSSEEVIGFCIDHLGQRAAPLFSATKVWTQDEEAGREQITASHKFWGLDKFSLNQVHNLVDWPTQLETLLQMKAEGRLQYVGITTSHGRRHRDLEEIMRTQPIDFIQLSYHINNRTAEDRLLPLAQEKGIAVIVNRPFMKGRLFDLYQNHALPSWAESIDCENWAQFFLKFVVSHPAVSCAIPATSRVDHMIENMGACYGRLPTLQQREDMVQYVQSL